MNYQTIFRITENIFRAIYVGLTEYASVTAIGAVISLASISRLDRLTADVKTSFVLDSKLQRIDDTPIYQSLRECLTNAFIHADYYGRRSIVIDKEFRKTTIFNPGTFRIGINEAIAGGISDARNGRIFNMFSLIKVGERSDYG